MSLVDDVLTIGRCALRLALSDFDLDVDFAIPQRGVVGLFGPSGSGKTSILRCIAGLEPAATGEIRIGGQHWLSADAAPVPAHARGVGYVFQESRLFPHLNVAKNLDYGARRRGGDATQVEQAREAAIDLLDLGALLERSPDALSGGERQRVAIGRALVCRPRLLLMDEPLASLDAERKHEILPYLDRLHDDASMPIVYVSHSVEEMQALCDRVIVLDSGRVRFEGALDEALAAPDAGFAERDEAASILVGRVEAYDEAAAVSRIALDAGLEFLVPKRSTPGRSVRLRIRATDVSLSFTPPERATILNALPCRIESVVTESAHHVTLRLALGDQVLLSRISRKSWVELELAPGLDVRALIKAVSIHEAAESSSSLAD